MILKVKVKALFSLKWISNKKASDEALVTFYVQVLGHDRQLYETGKHVQENL